MLKNRLQILLTIVFLAFVGWWVSFQSVVTDQGLSVQWFGSTYGVMALIGAIIGLFASQRWGGYKTVLGRALLFYSLGLLAQDVGQIISTYYVVVAKIDIPYPAWGDVGFFGGVLLNICATLFMAKAVGVRFSLQRKLHKTVAIAVFAAIIGTSYWVFLHNHQYDWHHPLTVFLDLGYPIGQALYISLAVTAYLLSRRMLGGIMRAGILIIIFALIIQYISDFGFLYQNSRGTFIAGRWDDLSYLTAYFVMSTAMVKFLMIYNGLRKKTADLRASAKSGVAD